MKIQDQLLRSGEVSLIGSHTDGDRQFFNIEDRCGHYATVSYVPDSDFTVVRSSIKFGGCGHSSPFPYCEDSQRRFKSLLAHSIGDNSPRS